MLARRTADDSPLGVSLFRFVPPKLELRSLPLSFSSSTSSPCARDSLSSISDLSGCLLCMSIEFRFYDPDIIPFNPISIDYSSALSRFFWALIITEHVLLLLLILKILWT